MKKILTLLIISLLFLSCASILNRPFVKIDVNTSEPALIIINQDSVKTKDNRATFEVQRQKKALKITTITDSTSKTVVLKSKDSFVYCLNAWPSYGLGYLIEMRNPKRFTYPGSIYIDMDDPSSDFLIYALPRKQEIYFKIGIPHVNLFLFQPSGVKGFRSNNGFLGLSIGFDYHYADDRFLSFTGSIVDGIDSFNADSDGEAINSSYLSISHNHSINRFSFGYGPTYAENTYYSGRNNGENRYAVIGAVFPVYRQLAEHFHAGFVYRPTYIRFDTAPLRFDVSPKLKYEHVISFEFLWKFKFRK